MPWLRSRREWTVVSSIVFASTLFSWSGATRVEDDLEAEVLHVGIGFDEVTTAAESNGKDPPGGFEEKDRGGG